MPSALGTFAFGILRQVDLHSLSGMVLAIAGAAASRDRLFVRIREKVETLAHKSSFQWMTSPLVELESVR